MKFLLAILLCTQAYGADMSKNIKVTGLVIEAEKAIRTNRNFLTPKNEPVAGYLNLRFNITIHKKTYINQNILSTYTTKQFRAIAWNPEVGYNFDSGVDVYYKHYSGHALDSKIGQKFPENNSVGIRFNFIKE